MVRSSSWRADPSNASIGREPWSGSTISVRAAPDRAAVLAVATAWALMAEAEGTSHAAVRSAANPQRAPARLLPTPARPAAAIDAPRLAPAHPPAVVGLRRCTCPGIGVGGRGLPLLGLDDSTVIGGDDGLNAVAHPELSQQVRDV